MKLVTFQSLNAFKDLVEKGYLICNDRYINKDKMNKTYEWVTTKMNSSIKNNENIKYPIWAWVKCYNNICPPKRKGTPINGFDVKITFSKKKEEVFITDFRRYSFLLNNTYIPDSLKDKIEFEKKLKKYNITKEDLIAYIRKDKYSTHRKDKEFLDICKQIEKSFDKCITEDSNILQGCIWKINLEEIEKIEILNDKTYSYGSINYIKSNGKRTDWINQYYKKLK